jgi:uncharacterized protein YkwD/LysM repeat protein
VIQKIVLQFLAALLTLVFALVTAFPARGGTSHRPRQADSPYDLINAVNALRASYGLSAYNINATLMVAAQSHAEFMAATGNVSHTGGGGSSVTDRLLSAGYPLAGDLSLGGFRSENITGGVEGKTALEAVNQWAGDAPHLNTMISPNLTEIGAGVAVANGRVYYVIDCARPTTSGLPQSSVPSAGSGSVVSANEAGAELIPAAVISTPNLAGDVIHDVKSGQTLWQIAITYNVKVDEIKAFNNLADNNIYPGEKLLIKKMDVMPAETPTSVGTVTAAVAPTLTATSTPALQAATSAPMPASTAARSNQTIMMIVMGIIALALLGGGIFARAGGTGSDPG